ncbi:hypothetical protein S83_005916 [Arachis hypogaea]
MEVLANGTRSQGPKPDQAEDSQSNGPDRYLAHSISLIPLPVCCRRPLSLTLYPASISLSVSPRYCHPPPPNSAVSPSLHAVSSHRSARIASLPHRASTGG